MTSRFEQDRQAEAREARIIAQTDALRSWLEEKHPDIWFGEAVRLAFMEDMGNSFLTATEEDFEYSLRTTRTNFSRQHVPTPEEVKTELIDKICSMIASSDGTGRDGKFSAFSLSTERTKMAHWSIEQLTQRLEEVVRKQTLSAKPITELHQIVKSGRKYQGYPTLGKTFVRPGTVRAVPLDAEYLKRLDPWELKRFVRLYGLEQVNDRLAGRD